MPEPLRVALTLELCWHDVPGGTAVATLELARRLDRRTDVEVIGVAGRHRHPPADPFRPPVAVRSLPLARPWLYETWNRFGRPRVEAVTGPIDVCHSTYAIPAGTSSPHVVTVHDVAFVHTPERFSRHGVRVMRRGLERARQADLVLCPSRAAADDLADLGFAHDRLRVVPWGVAAAPVHPADLERVRRAHRLPSEFVLFVGTLEPRKNLHRLVAATAGLDVPLVVAGASGWGEGAPAASHVQFLGFVADEHLRPLMAASSVLAYPSLEEGFGLPILEAMSQGTPVVTSAGSATEEVAGGAAVLVDPLDAESIRDGIDTARRERQQWSDRGLARAAACGWDDTVEATVAAYREVAR